MLENCPIESLIEFDRKEDEIYIQKNVSSAVIFIHAINDELIFYSILQST